MCNFKLIVTGFPHLESREIFPNFSRLESARKMALVLEHTENLVEVVCNALIVLFTRKSIESFLNKLRCT